MAPIGFDGTTLEGGGQLVRNALCLSALTGKSIRICNIRGNRGGGGGLKTQHLACVNWLAHACNAEVKGAELESKDLEFRPGKLGNTISPAYTKRILPDGRSMFECSVMIVSAGSTSLALQAVLPYVIFAPPLSTLENEVSFVRLLME